MINFRKIPLGAMASPVDKRDKTLKDFGVALVGNTPLEFVQPYIGKVLNQGQYGMCVACASSSIVESLEMEERSVQTQYSMAWIYGNRAQGDHQGEGMFPREALKQLNRFGVPEYNMLPLIGTYPTCKNALSNKINQLLPNAISQKIKGYVRLRGVQELKTFIYTYNSPVLVTIDIYDSFYNTNSDGIVPPNSGEFKGKHAMVCHGWKRISSVERYYVQNSWSEEWGKDGFCYIDPTTCKFTEMWGLINETPQEIIDEPKEILMTIGNNKAVIDGKLITMPQGPIIYNDKTMIPVREFAEPLGYKVKYYPSGDPTGHGSLVYIRNGGEFSDMADIDE